MLTSTKWRLLVDPPLEAAYNMSADEALLETTASGADSPPVLRFYGWQIPSLSLGLSQKFKGTALASNARSGIETVRRPTGGRAILHHLELTYSVVIPQDGTILESYRQISEALRSGFQKLSIPVEWEKRTKPATNSSFCFAVPSAYELSLGGKKLVGSAQVRKNGWLLQHGSILLDLHIALQKSIFGDAYRPAATLSSFKLKRETLISALLAGFEESFAMKGENGSLSKKEIERIATLIRDKYGNPEWTFCR